jgi:hypothetical protein
MTSWQALATVLLVGGGATVLLLSQPRRRNVARRLGRLDGILRPSAGQWGRAAAAGLVLLAVVALPAALVVAVQPTVIGVLAAVALLPTVAAIVAELHTGLRRPAMPVRVPFLPQRQRQLVSALVERAISPLPAPPLRHPRPRARRRPPTLTSAGGGRRLLVVPPGHATVRVWELAETYLGSRRRYRDVLSLNTDRLGPTGEKISEDSRIGPGWALIMPRDAIGVGLVDLPGDPRLSWTEPTTPEPQQGGLAPADPEEGNLAATAEPPPVEPPPVEPPPVEPPPVEPPTVEPEPPADVAAETSVIGSVDAVLDHPPADLPWDLVHGRLLAAGLLDTVAVHRAQREYHRPSGSVAPPLDPSAARVLNAAELGADRAGAEFLGRALRSIPAASMPAVRLARLRPGALELELVVPHALAPEAFAVDPTGRSWTVSRAARLDPVPDASPPAGLVSIGQDRTGWVLVDLAAAGGVVGVAGDARAARLVAMAVGLELALKRSSDESRVTMVGFGTDLDGLDQRLQCADRLTDVLDGLQRRAEDPERHAVPEFLVVADQPSAQLYERLRRMATPDGDEPGAGVGVLVVGGSRYDAWTFDLDAGGVLSCPELDVTVGAQALSTATVDAIAKLLAAEGGSVENPPAELPEPPRPVTPVPEVVVRLFGLPRLDGPDGPLDVDPLSVEIVAYLALHGISSPRDIAAAVFPFGTTEADLRTSLKAVVEALGRAPSGQPGLLEYDNGDLALTDDVQCDWHLFGARCAAGRLHDALALLDPGIENERPAIVRAGGYCWLGGVPLARALPGQVADVAHAVVAEAIRDGRSAAAVAAATVGLRVQPFSRTSRADLESARAMSAARFLEPGGGQDGSR